VELFVQGPELLLQPLFFLVGEAELELRVNLVFLHAHFPILSRPRPFRTRRIVGQKPWDKNSHRRGGAPGLEKSGARGYDRRMAEGEPPSKMFIIYAFALLAICVPVGVGAFTFIYGEGHAYLSNDPRVCVKCHIMSDQFNGWKMGDHASR